jgi:hypothetical protein
MWPFNKKSASKEQRKTLDEVINVEPELNPDHINDWHYCSSGQPFRSIQHLSIPKGNFNFIAAISSPGSIRYRQRDCDFPEGKRGDYIFMDQNGGRMAVPFKLFKLYFS